MEKRGRPQGRPFLLDDKRGDRNKRYERVNICDRSYKQSGIGVFGEKLLYHFGTFPVPL
jgi:hypothetical protein